MEPYISEKEADSSFSIMTQIDPTGGRWQTKSIHGLCEIVRKCLENHQTKRTTIEEVRFKYLIDILLHCQYTAPDFSCT